MKDDEKTTDTPAPEKKSGDAPQEKATVIETPATPPKPEPQPEPEPEPQPEPQPKKRPSLLARALGLA